MTSINLEVKEFKIPAVNLYEKYGFQHCGQARGLLQRQLRRTAYDKIYLKVSYYENFSD